jgi:hypothetical protein
VALSDLRQSSSAKLLQALSPSLSLSFVLLAAKELKALSDLRQL